MNLHESKSEFQYLILAASQALGIREVFVEKDYWVTLVLKQLSCSQFKDRVVFKGGTSVSKAYKLINRFSEDVDLALIDKGETDSSRKKLLKSIEKKIVPSVFSENRDHPINSKGSRFRKTAFHYPRAIENENFGHGQSSLILELNTFANPSPSFSKPIISYIGEFLLEFDSSLLEDYGLNEFDVEVLDIRKTFVEKVLAIARAGYELKMREDAIQQKIRHIYDLHMILSFDGMSEYLESEDFKKSLEESSVGDTKNPKIDINWKKNPVVESPFFADIDGLKGNLGFFYKNTFSSLVITGDLPDFDKVMESIYIIKDHLG